MNNKWNASIVSYTVSQFFWDLGNVPFLRIVSLQGLQMCCDNISLKTTLDGEVVLEKIIPKRSVPAFFFRWTTYLVTISKNTFPTIPRAAMTRNVYSSPSLMYSSENVQALRLSVEDSVVELELELFKSVSIVNFE